MGTSVGTGNDDGSGSRSAVVRSLSLSLSLTDADAGADTHTQRHRHKGPLCGALCDVITGNYCSSSSSSREQAVSERVRWKEAVVCWAAVEERGRGKKINIASFTNKSIGRAYTRML